MMGPWCCGTAFVRTLFDDVAGLLLPQESGIILCLPFSFSLLLSVCFVCLFLCLSGSWVGRKAQLANRDRARRLCSCRLGSRSRDIMMGA